MGTPAQIADQLRRWRTSGVEQVICSFGAPFAVYDDEQFDLAAVLIANLDKPPSVGSPSRRG